MQSTNMKRITLITALLFSCYGMNAQYVADYLKAADGYFEKGDYASAAEYYEKYTGKDSAAGKSSFNPYTPQAGTKKTAAALSSRAQAQYRLAECYRLLNYPSKAETQYREVMETGAEKYPLTAFHLASQLRALGRYAEAEKTFKTFLEGYSEKDEYRKTAERELKNLAFIQEQLKRKDLALFSISKAGGQLNSTGASYAPVWLTDNTILFTSTRPLDTTAKTRVYTNRLYEGGFENGQPVSVTLSQVPQDKNYQQGVAAITPDGNSLYLTRWGFAGGKKTASLYISNKTAAGWSEPVKIGEPVNREGSLTQQPFVTPDGKYLLFSSDRSGGQGGFDLWYAPLENGLPGNPVNMGAVINTGYDEQAPAYHPASSSLVFSSNGRVGMGGFDFFLSKGKPGGNWTEPQNPGYPVNSVKDDIYLISRGPANNLFGDVMLSSDRDAACCLELFSLKKIRPARELSGRVVSCDPSKAMAGALVKVIDPATNAVLVTRTTGPDGLYSFTLEDHRALKVEAAAEGFLEGSASMGTPSNPEEVQMRYPDLCLQPVAPKPEEVYVLENVYYDFNKATLKPESYPALDSLVQVLNAHPDMKVEIGSHTDNKGAEEYNQQLSEARAQSVVAYLQEKGIAADRLVAKGYGESVPVAPNELDGKDNPEGRAKNRRTEFKILKNE